MSSPLIGRVRAAMVAARKDRDTPRTLLYSTLLDRIAREVLAG